MSNGYRRFDLLVEEFLLGFQNGSILPEGLDHFMLSDMKCSAVLHDHIWGSGKSSTHFVETPSSCDCFGRSLENSGQSSKQGRLGLRCSLSTPEDQPFLADCGGTMVHPGAFDLYSDWTRHDYTDFAWLVQPLEHRGQEVCKLLLLDAAEFPLDVDSLVSCSGSKGHVG